MVLPGTYNVALVVDGKVVETKPLKIVLDPEMQMTDAQRKRYYDVTMELHELQKRGDQVSTALNNLTSQMTDASTKVKASKAPDALKTQFDTMQKDLESMRTKFSSPFGGGGRGGGGGGGGAAQGGGGRGGRGGRAGGGGAAGGAAAGAGTAGAAGGAAAGAGAGAAGATEAPPGGGGGGGGFGGGATGPADQSLLGRTATLKTQILAFQEMPSETYVKEYNELKVAMPKAIADANALLLKAMTLSQTLKKYDVALSVPSPVK